MLDTPVALFIFNRPGPTARVFERIAAQRPRRLLVVADGPRHEAERPLCEQTRALIRVDWPCELETNFSEANLGCKMRVSSGLNWVFERAERAIILEDDCLPSPDFFSFCELMLERYQHDPRVMHVAGSNAVDSLPARVGYGFSRYVHIWGWATWRRAWAHYDVDIPQWPAVRQSVLEKCHNEVEARYWDQSFTAVYTKQEKTWDYQWQLACWIASGLAVVPAVNLISNIGIGTDATHPVTAFVRSMANLPTYPWLEDAQGAAAWPAVEANPALDALDCKRCILDALHVPLATRIKARLGRIVPKLPRR